MNDYAFGNFLYELRIEKGLSQSQLGEMLGVTNKAVSKWENGSAKPNTRLIPKIAAILGVTVEELFAGKRVEKNSDFDKIKAYLCSQRKRYAVMSSVSFSALIILPLLLIDFICVVMGFNLPDDVVGPLGAVGLILAFMISLVTFVIYRNNFKHSLEPGEMPNTPAFVNAVRAILLSCSVAWLCLTVLTFAVYWLIIFIATDSFAANVFLSIAVFILILLLGVVICFVKIMQLLKISFLPDIKGEKKSIRFSALPILWKICYILVIAFYPIMLNILLNDFLLIKIAWLVIWFFFVLALIIYSRKKKK